jgi:hypothetical protein
MSEENTAADAEAVQNTAEQIDNTSLDEFTQRRLGNLAQEAQATEEQPQEGSEETEAEETAEETEENALSQLDIDNLSENELRDLADKLGSRAVARFGEMTAARRAAEERAAKLESMLQTQNSAPKKEIKDNPFNDLNTVQDLQKKSQEIESTIEWAEDLLFESDDYSADDVITEIDGKDLTKKEVRKALMNARKAQRDYIPDRLNKVQLQLTGQQLQTQYDNKAREELEWLGEESNPIKEQFFATLRDPQYNQLKKILDKELPQVSGQLEYMFAHAANSIYGRKPIVEESKAPAKKGTPSLTPTKTANTSAAKSEKPTSKTAKAFKDLQARFKTTGSARDFAEMRKLQIQNR